MFIGEADFGAAGLMLLNPDNLFGVDVHVFLLDIRDFDQVAHTILHIRVPESDILLYKLAFVKSSSTIADSREQMA